jgi:hypothetical protein
MGLHFYLDSSIPVVNDWATEKDNSVLPPNEVSTLTLSLVGNQRYSM